MANNWGNSLQPTGTGQGNTLGTVFGEAMNVAQQTGLDQQIAGAAMGMVAGPLGNEDQLGKIYHLFAAHPNEVSTFFLHHLNERGQPVFIAELANLITTIVRKELFAFFNSDMTTTNFINAEKALEADNVEDEEKATLETKLRQLKTFVVNPNIANDVETVAEDESQAA